MGIDQGSVQLGQRLILEISTGGPRGSPVFLLALGFSAGAGCRLTIEPVTSNSALPDSRVTLSDERDALGVRRAHLAWRMTDDDIDSVRRTLELLGRELGRTGRLSTSRAI